MMHWRARRLLVALPDGTLSARAEAALLAHVQRCERCRRELGEIERAESLLRRLPASLVPLDAAVPAAARLWRLGRWAPRLRVPDPERWNAPVLGLAGALAVVALTITVGVWSPILTQRGGGTTSLAAVAPESSYVPRTTVY